jgi:transposase
MIDAEVVAKIRRLYYAEHWRLGTIATQLGVHPDAVRRALNRQSIKSGPPKPRPRLVDPYLPLLQETLERYPRLRATVLYRMIRERGYTGSVVQLRRILKPLRPNRREVFLRLHSLPGEAAQVDWADFGQVRVGQAVRRLAAFVLTLSHSRALYVEFFFDQTLPNFLAGHVRAFEQLGGVPRILLTDNLRSVVLERRGDSIRFHPRYLELTGHYGFEVRPCHVARGNEKGRVERSIRYLRESFFHTHAFTTLEQLNSQVGRWISDVAHARPWPDGTTQTVAQKLADERPRLLPLPRHPIDTSLRTDVRSVKTLFVRFDRNDYSIPPAAVGKPLTLIATDTLVRVFDATTEIARHTRSFDHHRRIADPAHTAALLAQKRAAQSSTPDSPLHRAVPETERFLKAAMPRYRHTGWLVNVLKRLLALYGANPLNAALTEALDHGTPTLDSVEYLLEKHRRAGRRKPPLPVDLADRPELADLHVQPHPLSAYDQLADEPKSLKDPKDGDDE